MHLHCLAVNEKRGSVMTFMDVFVKVFDKDNRTGDLNIDIFLRKAWVV